MISTSARDEKRPIKVLVVDDDEDIRRIAQIALTRIGGMEVVEAGGALEGIEIAEREQPDAILLDVMMPGIDGATALRMLQRNPITRRIPVIFLTARTGDLDDAHVRALGAHGLLLKPFDPAALPGRVTALLAAGALPGA